MTSIAEVYFLVRVGTWGEEELKDYIDTQVQNEVTDYANSIDHDNDVAYDRGYESGHHSGYSDGHADGLDEGYTRGEQDGYRNGLSEGECNASKNDRW